MLEPNYHTTKFFTEYLVALETGKNQIYLMNKPVYFELSILELSKLLMYEFWYDFVKPKHDETSKFCYMDTDIVSLYTLNMIFKKTFQKMLKLDLILQITD